MALGFMDMARNETVGKGLPLLLSRKRDEKEVMSFDSLFLMCSVSAQLEGIIMSLSDAQTLKLQNDIIPVTEIYLAVSSIK